MALSEPERADVDAMSHTPDERRLVLPRRSSGDEASGSGTRFGRESRANREAQPIGDVAAPPLALEDGEGVERFKDSQVGARHHDGGNLHPCAQVMCA